MLKLIGIIKHDEIKQFAKKDGSVVEKRIVYIEPEGSVFPVRVSIDDLAMDIGKVGDMVSLNVEIYPFYYHEGKMVRAKVNFYMPKK